MADAAIVSVDVLNSFAAMAAVIWAKSTGKAANLLHLYPSKAATRYSATSKTKTARRSAISRFGLLAVTAVKCIDRLWY